MDFQDDHNKEYLVDGDFAQDKEIVLALIVGRVLDLSDGEQSSVSCVSSPCSDKSSISSGNRSWALSIFSCQQVSVSAVGVDNISNSVGERPRSSTHPHSHHRADEPRFLG